MSSAACRSCGAELPSGARFCAACGAPVSRRLGDERKVVSLDARADRGDEIVLGDVVNTAFRIEESTPDGSVYVGERTYRATRDAIEYGERRLVQGKGKPEPVAVWEALRLRSADA